jgi:hypothetical protein
MLINTYLIYIKFLPQGNHQNSKYEDREYSIQLLIETLDPIAEITETDISSDGSYGLWIHDIKNHNEAKLILQKIKRQLLLYPNITILEEKIIEEENN